MTWLPAFLMNQVKVMIIMTIATRWRCEMVMLLLVIRLMIMMTITTRWRCEMVMILLLMMKVFTKYS